MGTVLIEVSQNYQYGQELSPVEPEDFGGRAQEIADGVAEVARELGRRLNEAIDDDDPEGRLAVDSLQVSFGVTVKAETNILVVKAGGQSTFTVTVGWSAKR